MKEWITPSLSKIKGHSGDRKAVKNKIMFKLNSWKRNFRPKISILYVECSRACYWSLTTWGEVRWEVYLQFAFIGNYWQQRQSLFLFVWCWYSAVLENIFIFLKPPTVSIFVVVIAWSNLKVPSLTRRTVYCIGWSSIFFA